MYSRQFCACYRKALRLSLYGLIVLRSAAIDAIAQLFFLDQNSILIGATFSVLPLPAGHWAYPCRMDVRGR